MSKKLLIGLILTLTVIVSFSLSCYATDGNSSVVNGVRNVVGGAENAIENGAKGLGNAVKDGAGAIGNTVQGAANGAGQEIQNSANKTGESMQNGMNKIEDGMNGNNDNNNNNNNDNDNYTVTRTSADNTIMGMNSTMWTWIILGIAAIGIIAIVWYYSAQLNTNRHDDE